MRSELLPNGIDDLTDAVEDFIHGAQTVDVGEFSLFGVKVRDDGRLFVIYFDTVADHLLRSVVRSPGLFAPEQDAFYQLLFGNVHVDHDIDLQPLFGQHPVELLGLVRRTGKAVENVAFRVFVRRDIVGDHVDHHLVGSESARGDIGLHLFAEFRPPGDFFPNYVTGRYVIDSVFLFEPRRLRSLAASRGPE